jgi:hypothetical protein
MDIARIERALRAGPADEPPYVPGAFLPSRSRSRLRSALLAGGIAASIAVGVVVGLGLGMLRPSNSQVGGAAVDPAIEFRGHWISQGMTREAWIDALLAKGHRQEDIDAFLAHDPFQSRVHYEIDVTEDRILISAVFDGKPAAPMSGGPYEMVGSSTFRYDDVGCFVSVQFEVLGGWLSFDPPAFESCDADERIANTAFFNQWPYTRSARP